MSTRRLANDGIYGANISSIMSSKGQEKNVNKVEDVGLAPSLLQALHSHLRSSLFNSICADIRVRAFGRIYSLHRILLVQSHFFDSLLNGEFSEAKSRLGVWRSNKKEIDGESVEIGEDDTVMELHFDDPNITRPAFEYCIAILYGAAPSLILPEWSSPSPSFPLTSQFEPNRLHRLSKLSNLTSQSDSDGSVDEQSEDHIESHNFAQHPATPRFLLSLLATSSYLVIPSIISQALTLILCSITPFTISHYLRFALGYGITGALEAKERGSATSKEWDWELEGPAWGLENLGKEDNDQKIKKHSSVLSDAMAQMDLANDSSAKSHNQGTDDITFDSKLDQPTFGFHYGVESEKIGEACSCWLLRWGAETSIAEEQLHLRDKSEGMDYINPINLLPYGSMPDVFYSASNGKSKNKIRSALSAPQPIIWRHPLLGGLPASWVRMIISSDSFWIREEWERYEAAKRVVSMRRSFARIDNSNIVDEEANEEEEEDSMEEEGSKKMKKTGDSEVSKNNLHHSSKDERMARNSSYDGQSCDLSQQNNLDADEEADESEYHLLFAEGIYYTHLSFNRLSAISNDICHYTGQPYAPMHVLQGALWTQSELKNIVLSKVSENDKQVAVDSRTRDDEDEEESRGARDVNAPSRDIRETDEERELGLVSEENEFVRVCSSLGKRGRTSRAHLGEDGKPIVLGGVTPLMQPLTSFSPSPNAGALDSLLNKRFFAVPGDDTVRIGENLASLANGQNHPSIAMEKRQHAGYVNDSHNLDGPTGIAAAIDSDVLSASIETKFRTSDNFFGFCNAVRQGKELGKKSNDASLTEANKSIEDLEIPNFSSTEWTGFEPMRIGVEFYDVDRLTEKQRSYSPSFFYAGSVWNLYIQTVRKPKGLQLGIYLHRQNCSDTLPTPSRPTRLQPVSRLGIREGGETSMLQVLNNEETTNLSTTVRWPSPSHGSPTTQAARRVPLNASNANIITNELSVEHTGRLQNSPTSPIQSPVRVQVEGNNLQSSVRQGTSGAYSLTPSPSGFADEMSRLLDQHTNTDLNANEVQGPEIPYSDQRRILRAYFSIHCPSPMGSSLTKFSSRPDNFTLSQSWGWKSSSLLGAVYLEEGKLGTARSQISQTFRCIVTMGVV